MKKSLLLLGFISYFSFGQITDQNGNSAASSNGTPLSGEISINTRLDVFGSAFVGDDTPLGRVAIGRDYYGGELGVITSTDEVLAVKFNNRFEYGGGIPGSGRLVVTQAGNVGIGTINPAYKLDVFGTALIGDDVGERIAVGLDYYGGELGMMTTEDDILAVKFNDRFEYGGGAPGSGRLVVTQAGNVGIGTINPSHKLEVLGTAIIGDDVGERISIGFDWYGGELGMMTTTGDDILAVKFNNRFEYGGGVPGSGRLVVTQAGNVGIGTINPIYKFDIHGQNALAINGCAIADVNKSSGIIKIGDIDGEDAQLALYDNWTNEIVRIADGKVGIGTTNPDEKLSVNGTIHAKEVRVDLIGWPDYVFDENYDLPSLKDVEKYIKENGHLKNIPNAEDVEKNGVPLGEMNKKLLEKIEELTLYLIQKDKDIEELKKQVEYLMQKQ